MDLSAKAYARSTASDAIVHFLETSSFIPAGAAGGKLATRPTRMERWVYGERSRTILDTGDETYDQVIGADGVLRNHIEPGGEDQTLAPGDTEYASIISASNSNPVSQYRARYNADELTDAGTTTFDGAAAHAYTHTETARFSYGPETTTDTFYVNPVDDELLGSRRDVENANGTSELVRRLSQFERLEPTPQNLAKRAR